MTVKKWRIFLAADVEKEEAWLNDMSAEGLHLIKYRFFRYDFEEDPNRSYVYQIDFQWNIDKSYFAFFKDAGWESVKGMGGFHYFRRDASLPGQQKIYSDSQSMKESYKEMLRYYMMIFIGFLFSQLAGLLTVFYAPFGTILPIVLLVLCSSVTILYVYLFMTLRRKIQSYERKEL